MMDAVAKLALIAFLIGTACGHRGFTRFDDATGDGDGDGKGDGVMSDGPPMQSCVGLAPTCGPMGMSPCCDSPLVPGGTFLRTYDVGTDGAYVDMTNPATVGDFRLDTYEITVGRFRQFVTARMGTQTTPPAAGAGARMLNGIAGQGGWDPSWNGGLTSDTSTLIAAMKC